MGTTRRSTERSTRLATALILGMFVATGWAGAQSSYPIRWDEPEAATLVTVDVERLDAEIVKTPSSTSTEEVIIPLATVDELCGDGNGCSLRLLVIANQPKVEPAWFALLGSNSWNVKLLDTSGLYGELSDFHDIAIFTAHRSVFDVFQSCELREHTESGDPVSLMAFSLRAENTGGQAHRCVLRIDD